MTYTELAAQHEAELNRPDMTSMTQQWIEDAYRDIMARDRFSWLQIVTEGTSAADQYEYGLPSDFNNIINLVFRNADTDSWEMNIYDQLAFDALHPNVDEDTAGKPEDATIVTSLDDDNVAFSNLVVWPKPDLSTYTYIMRYEMNPPALSGALSPIIPTKYHQGIVFGSLARGFARLREYEASLYWEKKYEGMIARMIADDKYMAPRKAIVQPFSGAQVLYPPEYWKKYTVKGVR